MKLHPATIPYRAASKVAAVASALVFAAPSLAGVAAEYGLLLIPVGVLAIVAVLGYEVAYYRRFEFELTADALEVHSGVFARRDREIPYRRIQNVDVSRNVVQRVLGVAAVKVETAGGGETEATLQLVSVDAAASLQEELRTRKRAATREGEAGEAPSETVLFELDDEDLVRLSLLSTDPRVVGGVALLASFTGPVIPRFVDGFAGVALGGLLVVGALLVVLAIWLLGAAATFVKYYGFRLTRVDDDLRYERGLLQRYDGTIPLDKVQAFAVEEHVLMRRFGYAALAVETAGYAPGQSPEHGSEAAVPLADREDVVELAARIDPDAPLGPDVDLDLAGPPPRAKNRYTIRYGLGVAALVGVAAALSVFVRSWPWYVTLALLPLARVAAGATYRHRGWTFAGEHVVTRNGFWKRTTHAVPYDRVQTVIDKRGLFQRRWGLATVYADTASSRSLGGQDPAAVDLELGDADAFRRELADRTFDAIGAESSTRI